MSEATESGKGGGKILVVVLLIAAVIGVIAVKNQNKEEAAGTNTPGAGTAAESSADGSAAVSDKIPTLIDLGSKSCVPCKMMAPILEELTKEYAGRMKVVFIDVWENKRRVRNTASV